MRADNILMCKLPGAFQTEVVDFPGHLRMRGKANDMVKEALNVLTVLS